MPRLNRELTVKLIDVEFGLSAAIHRGEKPPNGIRLLSDRTDIPRRTLSGAVYCGDQIAEHRISRIARALNVKPDVLKSEDKKDDGPKEEKAHPDRRGDSKGKGPKRPSGVAA